MKPFPAETEAALAALEAAGHPVIRWDVESLTGLGAEFLRWEIATAVAGAVIGVDPFDEPNVTEAKTATRGVLDRFLAEGAFAAAKPVAAGGAFSIEAPPAIATALGARAGRDAAAWLPALLALAKPGDYLALLAYMRRTPERHERIERLRLALRNSSHLATTTGWGPRFLHSTGQLHKGGPNTGIFVQLTCEEGAELAIPGEKYGFGALRRAQYEGDYEVLARRERRVIRVNLGSEVERGLDALIETVESGAAAR